SLVAAATLLGIAAAPQMVPGGIALPRCRAARAGAPRRSDDAGEVFGSGRIFVRWAELFAKPIHFRINKRRRCGGNNAGYAEFEFDEQRWVSLRSTRATGSAARRLPHRRPARPRAGARPAGAGQV